MALRTEKDRAKAQQEKFQAILSGLLKDEDNKYCEDCDAKGPRWASWNLGIFLCIRCAGIHRNLGVHISRVKSVNLDSWTPEQIAMMQEMGNSRARAVYEANVPDTFRRPQTDSALEAFIRAKYEHKKYIAKEWIPPKPVVPKEWLEDDKVDKKKTRSKPTSNISLNSGPPSSQSTASSAASSEAKAKAKPAAVVAAEPKPAQPQPPKPKSGSDDLLGLDAEVPQNAGSGQGGDLLADLFGGSPMAPAQGSGGEQNLMSAQQNGAAEADLFESGINGSGENQGEKKTAKDSIMALYGNSGGQQQMFGVPGGMYMPQQPMYGSGAMPPMVQQQQGMMGQPIPQGMMGQPMPQGMMGMQQQPGGAMFAPAGQMGPGMMARPGGQMFMQQPQQQAVQQPVNPMQQQMQFQQMQQQMASMTMGGSQMGGMQQPQQAAVGGGSWGGPGTGQTLSTNLWQ